MTNIYLSGQRGWVSLPIIALLLALSTLSAHYQQGLQAGFKWRSQLNDVTEEQKIWADFYQAWVVSAHFSAAQARHMYRLLCFTRDEVRVYLANP